MQPECLTELQQELHHKYLNGFKLVFLFFCMLLLASLALKDDFLQRKLTFWVLKQVFVFHQENLSIALYFDARKQYQLSKHLKDRLDPPVSNKKCMQRKMSTLSSCVLEVSWIPMWVKKSVCNEKCLKNRRVIISLQYVSKTFWQETKYIWCDTNK